MHRREGLAKLSGRERYVDDLDVADAWWGMTVRSPVARGRIRGIHFSPDIPWDEYVIVDYRDIPGENVVHLIEADQPALAATEVRHVHEPVILVAHRSRAAVRRAVAAVTIEIDLLMPVFDVVRAPTPEQIQFGGDNVFKHIQILKGDVERALVAAPIVVEGTYRTGAQEHVYLEPQGMLAAVDAAGVVTVHGSMQCPYYAHAALCRALGRGPENVRVVQTPTGGGFGGKEEYPSMIAIHAALLALKAGRPVKIVYDRGEDMAATTKRHPSWTRHRTGVSGDGRLVAQDIEFVLDGGAYMTLSPVVLSRGVIHAAGPYCCDHVRIDGRAMLSNAVPFGAFRGFGAPQSLFAVERHMDVVADRLGLDPAEFRRRNLLRDGETTSTGQVIDDGTDRVALLDRALASAHYEEKRAAHRRFNTAEPVRRRGIGLATFYHGAGFTGAGEIYLNSQVHVAGLADGRVEVRTASTEMGQGTITVFTQLVADRLGYDPDDIVIAQPDTARVPNSGPTVASRTAMIVGRLVELACDDLRRAAGAAAAGGAELKAAIAEWHRQHPGGELLGRATYQAPPGIVWDEEAYRGDAYGTFAWSTQVAEVEVDLRTMGTTVLDFVAVQEIGKVLNETLARGQIQGGVAQGIGWALMEQCRWRDGAMINNQLTNYIIPTSGDLPPIRVEFLENPYPHGAQGAKGIGELPIDGPAPALLNAIAAALGVQPTAVPCLPEDLLEAVTA